MGRATLRTSCALPAAAALVWALGGAEAFWLSVPVALLFAAPARTPLEAALAAALALAGGLLPAALIDSHGPAPSLPLALAVVAASAAVMEGLRARLTAERAHLRRSALTDPLTGLANRRALTERASYEVARHARLGHRFAIVMLDLDGFKALNDRFGHGAGDELLRDVAGALRDAARRQDTVARLGGDEFCVLAPETALAGGERLAARLTTAIASATAGLAQVGASAGVATWPDDGETAAEVLRAADVRQMEAKRSRATPARERAA
jgi:diguanylate cyclase (GGDEF)-like protein